ncbi:acetyl-CoA carboxylase biotin carboxylase subunit [Streptomyces pharetrae]|uniref:acetyl-CoA carboxylase biotin carboxylase subunit n=1 Tax=Streptomyces pharetrae TaxID=291370 RepID=UPI003351CBC4
MFDKVLIANRGEIALRIIRACRDLGVRTVAVYSTPDADARFVHAADEAVHIGPGAPTRSYLNIPNIIGAALRTGAQAIHPGYGFLSEDPYFAEICADAGITFIGPPPDVMENVGDKATARRLMTAAGLPLLPGTTEPVDSAEAAEEIAREIGYPVIIKAAAGGGGRGITVVHRPEDLKEAYVTTRAGAQAVFKNSAVYLERYLPVTRHIEIQVLCDDFGGAVHLGERDCSVQRRHQKLVEESPAPGLPPKVREQLGAAAVAGARAVGYRGAGTVEFLLETDPAADHAFWFMEMNARIQVEHPVTELVTGVDLIAEQLRVAAGRPLTVRQEDIEIRGHALECRINAEDPDRGFAPTPGLLENYRAPGGPWVRVDTDYVPGSRVSPYYDSMIGKLIVWGPDRATALDRTLRALEEFDVSGPGVRTTIPLHQEILRHPEFRRGGVPTDFLSRHFSL